MKQPLLELRDYLKKAGVDYGDIRHESIRHQNIEVRNGEVERLSDSRSAGIGVRVLVNGAWGFAATSELGEEEFRKAADMAIQVARASATTLQDKVQLAETEPYVDRYDSYCQIDPFDVPLDRKIDILQQCCEKMMNDERIRTARGRMGFINSHKWFISTEGAEIEQTLITSGAGIEATAVSGGDAQKRSYPAGHGGDVAKQGFEFIEKMDLLGNAERVREEALELLQAPECPSGAHEIVLTGSQMALQVHESCGHPIELDRVLGTELSLAGGSFLSMDKRGGYQYGSPLVHIVADATIPGGNGSFGFDDEGVPGQRYDIVKDGVFVDYLSSRETAPMMNEKSRGTMRATSWSHLPLIRMTNVNLEPGQGSLGDMIGDIKKGILMDSNKVWSIDDMRWNFQFGCEIAWEIEGGKIGRVLKNPAYSGITPEFWSRCTGVCGPEEWHVWGVSNCGKGQPMQIIGTGHGAAPTRFSQIQVGATK